MACTSRRRREGRFTFTMFKAIVAWLLLVGVASAQPAQTVTATPTAATPTPTQRLVADRDNQCASLSDSSVTFIGQQTYRNDIVYWAYTGPCYCGHPKGGVTPTPNKTPGNGFSILDTGTGVHLCNFQDQYLACFGTGCIICYDEGRMVTPTPG